MYNSDHTNKTKAYRDIERFPYWRALAVQPSKEELRSMLRDAVENTRKQQEK